MRFALQVVPTAEQGLVGVAHPDDEQAHEMLEEQGLESWILEPELEALPAGADDTATGFAVRAMLQLDLLDAIADWHEAAIEEYVQAVTSNPQAPFPTLTPIQFVHV